MAMSSSVFGIVCLLLFALSQGVRDALFGNIFQSVSFLFIATLAFGLSCVVFFLFALLRRPKDLVMLARAPGALVMLNVTTAIAWLGFLYGLRDLEPAVVATFYNGVGPLVALVAGLYGWSDGQRHVSLPEMACYAGLAATLVALAALVLTGYSGMALDSTTRQAVALAAVAGGGAMITVSYIVTLWFADEGVGSDAVMSARFPLTLAIAAAWEFTIGGAGPRPAAEAVPMFAVAAFALIVLPSFLVQLGVSRTSPLTANVLRALGPVCVFAVQQLDGRLTFSGATLACIAAFCFFAIAASFLRGWSDTRAEASVSKL
ncbi:MAG: hypothetical protein ACR2PI_24545 [Hyphomicrobiaceae bacterium]